MQVTQDMYGYMNGITLDFFTIVIFSAVIFFMLSTCGLLMYIAILNKRVRNLYEELLSQNKHQLLENNKPQPNEGQEIDKKPKL
jgi:hypothetical protein